MIGACSDKTPRTTHFFRKEPQFMLRILSDTSTLYSSQQAQDAGFLVAPLSVTIAGKSYREFDEISADQFVSIIREGNMPTSSQPAIGEVLALYEQFPNDDILNISMAAGLSGTYASAAAAADLCEGRERITVINSRTLCGPHRHIVEAALRLAKEGADKDTVIRRVHELMNSAKSYLIPADFAYLRRGGRLSPLVSYVGQLTKMAPILTQTENGEHLTIAGVRRSFRHAVRFVAKQLEPIGTGDGWHVYITHGATPQLAHEAHELLCAAFPAAHFELLPLSPAFITQGGPACVAIQIVRS